MNDASAAAVQAPNFTAEDAIALLMSASLPGLKPTQLATTPPMVLTVEKVVTLPSYDDKNWLVFAKFMPSSSSLSQKAEEGNSVPSFSVVIKASLLMPVERVVAHVHLMQALAQSGLPVPAVIELGTPLSIETPLLGVKKAEDDDEQMRRIKVGNGMAEKVTEYVWSWTEQQPSTSVVERGESRTASIMVQEFVSGCYNWDKMPQKSLRSNAAQMHHLGSIIGQFDSVLNQPKIALNPMVLNGLRRPATTVRPEGFMPWDTRCVVANVRESLAFVSAGTKRLCEPVLQAFEQRVQRQLRDVPPADESVVEKEVQEKATEDKGKSFLPWGLIHNDLNESNILAFENGDVAAIVDFGDAVFTHRIFELAHAVCYMLQLALKDVAPELLALVEAQEKGSDNKPSNTTTEEAHHKAWAIVERGCISLCKGYCKAFPLTFEEIDALLPSALARTVMSVATAEASVNCRAAEIDEATRTYVMQNSVGGRAILRLFSDMDMCNGEPRLSVQEVTVRLHEAIIGDKA